MLKILSIGNSFSNDAHRYLYGIFRAGGEAVKNVNLYIGGCSLRMHYLNILEDAKSYHYEFRGEYVGLNASIHDALLSDEWDVVTLQQVSHRAPHFETYTPYLAEVAAYVRKYQPNTKLMFQQTWAYEDGSERLQSVACYPTAAAMLADIKAAYEKANEAVHGAGIIPAGEVLYKLHELGVEKVHRDTYHASFGVGRYALALAWFASLTGKSVADNTFNAFDEPVSDEEIALAKEAVRQVIG